MTSASADLLRRLTICDERALSQVMGSGGESPMLDERTSALVYIAALAAADGAATSFQSAVERAHAVGVNDDEILEVALAVAPIVGVARIGTTVQRLLASVGYDGDTPGAND